MRECIKKLKLFMEDNSHIFNEDCQCPALYDLYWHYEEHLTMENDKTRRVHNTIEDLVSVLSEDRQKEIFCFMDLLCREHECIAFVNGLKIGGQLMLEMKTKRKDILKP